MGRMVGEQGTEGYFGSVLGCGALQVPAKGWEHLGVALEYYVGSGRRCQATYQSRVQGNICYQYS